MKKLLTILGAVGLTATTGATVVACGGEDKPAAKSDFTVLAVDINMTAGEKSTLAIQDYNNAMTKFADFKVVLSEDQQKTLTISEFREGFADVTALKEGSVTFKVEATESTGPQADSVKKHYSQEITITVAAAKQSLNNIKIPDLAVKVSDNAKLTDADVKDTTKAIQDAVKNEIIKTITNAKLTDDYTIDLAKIVKDADLSKEALTIEVKANPGSKLITGDSKTSIKVTFAKKA